jgi:hypothetical protein
MKTLTMFLVLSTLTITACSGSVPDANVDGEPPATAATPQSSPVDEGDAIPRERENVVVPIEGNPGAPLGHPGATGGAGGSGGATASGLGHRMQ